MTAVSILPHAKFGPNDHHKIRRVPLYFKTIFQRHLTLMGRTNDTLDHKKKQLHHQHDLGHQQISQHMSNSTTFEGWSEEEVAKYKGNIIVPQVYQKLIFL